MRDKLYGPNGPWEHKPIEEMVWWTEDYVVYIGRDLMLDFDLPDTAGRADLSAFNDIFNEAAVLEMAPSKELGREKIIQSKRLIGEALVCAIEDDYQGAQRMLAAASAYITARNQELSRYWYLSIVVAAFVPLCLFAAALWLLRDPGRRFLGDGGFWVALSAVVGSLGATLSVIVRSGNLQFDASSGRRLHHLEGFSRLAAGALSGAAAGLAVHAGLVLRSLGEGDKSHGLLLLAAFAAGAGERLVTSIISDVNALGATAGKSTLAPLKKAEDHAGDGDHSARAPSATRRRSRKRS
jgi:hypothetical protein